MSGRKQLIRKRAQQLVEEGDYPASSVFVELFWLPVLGPSATVLFRRLNLLLKSRPDGITLEMDVLSSELGLGTAESKHSPLRRAISRLERFGLAKRSASGQLAVRRGAGPLPQHLLNGLDTVLQDAHQSVISRERACDRDPPATVPSPTAGLTGD
jgi:hypothetical protein